MDKRRFACIFLIISGALAHGQVKLPGKGKTFGKLTLDGSAFKKGPVHLSNKEAAAYSAMVEGLKKELHATGLFCLDTGFVPAKPSGFPDLTLRVYAGESTPLKFLLRTNGIKGLATKYVLQVSTDPTNNVSAPPYLGWEKPTGLVSSQEFTAAAKTNPNTPSDTRYVTSNANFQLTQHPDTDQNAQYVYFTASIPYQATLKSGATFFVRVVPISGRGYQKSALDPTSNWLPFFVDIGRKDQYDARKAQDLAYEAQKKEKQHQKDLAEQASEIQEIKNAFEIRLVSYIPPKFRDDAPATDMFVANTDVNFSGDGSAYHLTKGNSYSVGQLKTILNSNKTWSQELWDILTAELNLVSKIYADAKNLAVQGMASAISALPGIDCSGTCQADLMMGLDFALAYCGIPPSLPNFDQLYANGADYLAKTVADIAIEQVTGIATTELPDAAPIVQATAGAVRDSASKGISAMIQKIGKPAPFDPAVPESWGTPDPFFREHPAMLYLQIRKKPGANVSFKQTWQDIDLGFDGDFQHVHNVLLPRDPGASVIVPVALGTTGTPSDWNVAGNMPEPHSQPEFGQPYYYNRGQVNISIVTSHRIAGKGSELSIIWPKLTFQSAFVNAIEVPHIHTKAEYDQALQGPVKLAPDSYIGKTYLIPFN